jgi:hypothetical protein
VGQSSSSSSMESFVALGAGGWAQAAVEMTDSWVVTARLDGTTSYRLQLQAVLPCSGELLYLFAADGDVGLGAAAPLPQLASELLVYAPLLPLLKRPGGFQGLSRSAWQELTSAEKSVASFMQVSAGDSLAVVGEEAEGVDLELSEAGGDGDDDDDVEDEEPSEAEAGVEDEELDAASEEDDVDEDDDDV